MNKVMVKSLNKNEDMTVYDFLILSPKEMGKFIRSKGVNHYNDFPHTFDKACKMFDLVDDGRIEIPYWYTTTRNSQLEWYFIIQLNTEMGEVKLSFEYLIRKDGRVRAYDFKNAKFYKKTCPLFDEREHFNNLEYYLYSKELDLFFSEAKKGGDYINTIETFIHNIYPHLKKCEEYCFNGEFEKSHDRFNFDKFRKGVPFANYTAPSFQGMVNCFYNLDVKYNIKASLDDVMALWSYVAVNKDVYYDFTNKTLIAESDVVTISKLFDFNGELDNISTNFILQLINKAKDERSVNKDNDNRKSWSLTLKEMKKEFYYAIEELREDISKKYNIDKKYLDFNCYYSPKYPDEPQWKGNVPEEYQDRFR